MESAQPPNLVPVHFNSDSSAGTPGGGEFWYVRNLEWRKLVRIKIWHQFLPTTGKFGAEFPDCGTTSIDRECGLGLCCYFPDASEWVLLFPGCLLSFPGGFWMVSAISCRLLDGC